MNFGGPTFVITIILICMVAWVITTAIRAKHGYPLTDDWGNTVHPTKGSERRPRRGRRNKTAQIPSWGGALRCPSGCDGPAKARDEAKFA